MGKAKEAAERIQRQAELLPDGDASGSTEESASPKGQSSQLARVMDSRQQQIADALAQTMPYNQFRQAVLTAAGKNPQLFNCEPVSMVAAVLTIAQLGLMVDAMGQAHIAPFYSQKHQRYLAQVIIGYRGVFSLLYRHPRIASVNWGIVREGDAFEYQKGTDAFLRHVPSEEPEDERPVTHYWVDVSVVSLGQLGHVFDVWSRDKAVKHMERYVPAKKRGKGTAWFEEFDKMSLKSLGLAVSKVLPMLPNVSQMLTMADGAVHTELGPDLATTPTEEDEGLRCKECGHEAVLAGDVTEEDIPSMACPECGCEGAYTG